MNGNCCWESFFYSMSNEIKYLLMQSRLLFLILFVISGECQYGWFTRISEACDFPLQHNRTIIVIVVLLVHLVIWVFKIFFCWTLKRRSVITILMSLFLLKFLAVLSEPIIFTKSFMENKNIRNIIYSSHNWVDISFPNLYISYLISGQYNLWKTSHLLDEDADFYEGGMQAFIHCQ